MVWNDLAEVGSLKRFKEQLDIKKNYSSLPIWIPSKRIIRGTKSTIGNAIVFKFEKQLDGNEAKFEINGRWWNFKVLEGHLAIVQKK